MPANAVLLIAFGGPTKPEEIRPFLANVLRGRPVTPERIEDVVHHYEVIGGRSPLNELTFRQAGRLEHALAATGHPLPIYVGMRNWEPYLADTLARMAAAGVRRAIGVILAPHATEASRERYTEAVDAGRAALGAGAPEIAYIGSWHTHPLFVTAMADATVAALVSIPAARRASAPLVFTAHSVPVPMAERSTYVTEFTASARAVAERLRREHWVLAYQSRSGRPGDPWLEPDVNDVLRTLASQGARDAVLVPVGFVADHVEVLYDLDVEAQATGRELGMQVVRAGTVGDHPLFARMLAEVIGAALA